MTTTSGRVAAILIAAAFIAAAAPAAADPVEAAKAIPADVSEVLTGGGWQQGDQVGTYRVVTTYQGSGEQSYAAVALQWIAFDRAGGAAVVETVPINEINERKLRSVFVGMEADKENEVTLIVTHIGDDPSKEENINVVAGLPGRYRLEK